MDVQQSSVKFNLLAEFSQLLTTLNLGDVLQKVIDLAIRSVGANKARIFLIEHDLINWHRVLTMEQGEIYQSVQVISPFFDRGFAGWVYHNQQGSIIEDTQTDDRWLQIPDQEDKVRSALSVPLIHRGEVLAVLTLVHDTSHYFQPYHLQLMMTIANQVAVAIRNAQLFYQIESQQRHLETVLHSINDVLLVLDEQCRILLLNSAALQWLNLDSPINATNSPLADFVDLDASIQQIINMFDSPPSNQRWSFGVRSERVRKDFQVEMSQWIDRRDGTRGYVIMMHDVTMLRDLHRFKDEMLNVATHDLRSPLSLILGYIDMIDMDTPDPQSPVKEYVKTVKQIAERMSGLLDDILRVERIQNSPLELEEKVDIGQMVKVVLVNMRLFTEAKKQELASDILLRNISYVIADPVLIRQAMENLISNAIKYTPEGGKITIHASYDQEKFYFSVEDTGIGIAEEHLKKVFERFYRVKNPKSREKGVGLGLNLVKNVIERHRGEVWVKSKLNSGSHFGFWIPLSSEAE